MDALQCSRTSTVGTGAAARPCWCGRARRYGPCAAVADQISVCWLARDHWCLGRVARTTRVPLPLSVLLPHCCPARATLWPNVQEPPAPPPLARSQPPACPPPLLPSPYARCPEGAGQEPRDGARAGPTFLCPQRAPSLFWWPAAARNVEERKNRMIRVWRTSWFCSLPKQQQPFIMNQWLRLLRAPDGLSGPVGWGRTPCWAGPNATYIGSPCYLTF